MANIMIGMIVLSSGLSLVASLSLPLSLDAHKYSSGPTLNQCHPITIIDSYSKCPELFLTSSPIKSTVTEVLMESLNREGIPQLLVNNNGWQFCKTELICWLDCISYRFLNKSWHVLFGLLTWVGLIPIGTGNPYPHFIANGRILYYYFKYPHHSCHPVMKLPVNEQLNMHARGNFSRLHFINYGIFGPAEKRTTIAAHSIAYLSKQSVMMFVQ